VLRAEGLDPHDSGLFFWRDHVNERSSNMAGAGGGKAANHLFSTARRDGLVIGNPSIGMVSSAVLGDQESNTI
jgi:hypothetical protein